jgi:hypothetical protein
LWPFSNFPESAILINSFSETGKIKGGIIMKIKVFLFAVIFIAVLSGMGCDKECPDDGGTTEPNCCALPFTEWDGFTHGVKFIAAHSGIAIISAGNTVSDPASADVQITIDKDNSGTNIKTYRDYTGHSATADKYWSTVTVPFKKGDGVTITPNRYTSVNSMVYYFAD